MRSMICNIWFVVFLFFLSSLNCEVNAASSSSSSEFVATAVSSLDTFIYNGDQPISFSYTVGGGCEEHRHRFSVEFKRQPSNAETLTFLAKMHLEDVTDSPDTCKSLVTVTGKVDLKKYLEEEFDKFAVQQKLSQAERAYVRLIPELSILPAVFLGAPPGDARDNP